MSTVDPSAEENVARTARETENAESNPKTEKKDKSNAPQKDGPTGRDQDAFAPTEHWFASTASPLLAATFGPMANSFSIVALVYAWREYIPPGSTPEYGIILTDPKWLVAINAVSLVFALIGNVTLLLNMAKRVRFSIAQPMTITGFFIAGILLIADMAYLASSSSYFITQQDAIPAVNHALTGAFYYAIWAAAIYIIVGCLMCVTVQGAIAGHYSKDFQLTPSQRTMMLQTMIYMGYWLIGAAVFGHIEGWNYLDAVYWAQVTLLTIGFGDYYPTTNLARGLLFPYAVGGILTVGMVIGSIRTLVLERGEQKIAARITEKRREKAINNVDARKQTVQISFFAKADFSTDPSLTPAQRREEEFVVMRKVQKVAERQKRYFGLFSSLFFVLVLWFVGAAIFMRCEKESDWTYFDGVYFSFVSLVTIGYGDLSPVSEAGKAFFVLWSMLAIPSLTILISNMGDTIVKWVSDITELAAKFTLLPEKAQTAKGFLARLTGGTVAMSKFTGPGPLGAASSGKDSNAQKHYQEMMERLAERLESHIEQEELEAARKADDEGDILERDIRFYHYVLSRETRHVQKDLGQDPPKQYTWHEWEYFLKLMGNGSDDDEEEGHFPGQRHANVLVPDAMRVEQNMTGNFEQDHNDSKPAFPSLSRPATANPADAVSSSNSSTVLDADKDGVVDRQTEKKNKFAWHGPTKHLKRNNTNDDPLSDWSWLSEESPLMSSKSEAEWIVERLSAALVRELNRERKGFRRKPPITMRHVLRASEMHERHLEAEKRGDEEEAERARAEEGKAVWGES